MSLSGKQLQQLSNALRDAFTKARLEQMLRFRLDKRLDDIALGDDYEEIVFKLLTTAESQGWTFKLIVAARESNPGNAMLLAFSQQLGLAPTVEDSQTSSTPSRPQLEKLIKTANYFSDINEWRKRLGEIEVQVCRVEINGEPQGTGFLLGPSVVITNYHVMNKVIEEKPGFTPDKVILRFDYKRLADGLTVKTGTAYRLADEWLIDYSPYSQVDLQAEPKSDVPQPDELDYALLRLDGSPGDEPVGENSEPGAPMRGWIKVPAEGYAFEPHTALYIAQHPKGEPMKLALDTDAVIGPNANGTRVTYTTNTEPGSSGSPCFNGNWDLVALHHSGDPAIAPSYNEGIPFSAIMALLDQRGLRSELGEQPL